MSARDVIGRAIHGREFADGGYILVDSILEDLTEAGYAVVKLPEPIAREDDAEIATCWDVLPHQALVWDETPDEVQLSCNFEPSEPMSPAEARELAAALLAAAAHAEAGDSDD